MLHECTFICAFTSFDCEVHISYHLGTIWVLDVMNMASIVNGSSTVIVVCFFDNTKQIHAYLNREALETYHLPSTVYPPKKNNGALKMLPLGSFWCDWNETLSSFTLTSLTWRLLLHIMSNADLSRVHTRHNVISRLSKVLVSVSSSHILNIFQNGFEPVVMFTSSVSKTTT